MRVLAILYNVCVYVRVMYKTNERERQHRSENESFFYMQYLHE